MKRIAGMAGMISLLFLLTACGKNSGTESDVEAHSYSEITETKEHMSEAETMVAQPDIESERETMTEAGGVMKMNVQVGSSTFTAALEDNAAVDSFVQMMEDAPVVIQMSDYSGFEKVGSIGAGLPGSDSQITTQSGDIVLYNGNQIVIFYGSNSWSYTRLGKIDELSGWEEALGDGDVTVTFSME